MVKTNATSGQKTEDVVNSLRQAIRNIADFPKAGIIFRDITPLLGNPKLFAKMIDLLAQPWQKNIDYVVGIESRGFILGSAVAYKIQAGFVPVRKKGKLPHKTESVTYQLEYGQDSLEIHQDAFAQGNRVLIVDDVLATGGTAEAVAELVEKVGGKIKGVDFLIELTPLKGRNKINQYPLRSLIQF